MSTKHLLAPDLQIIADLFPELRLSAKMLPSFRAARAKEITLAEPAEYNATRKEILISREGEPDVRALLYTPDEGPNEGPNEGRGAGYLHIHGGGYVMGSPEQADAANLVLCAKLGIVVLSVSYRLAPEHSIPAPLNDCYAGLGWLHENAQALGVDPERIAVGGESAGGGLAAALAIHARDKGEYAICHQHLTYPMLDNQTGSAEHMGDRLVGEFVWTRQSNQFGWEGFLGDAPATAPQVPARVEDYSGLPPAWIHTVGLDLFRDENIRYAQGLMAAGVAVELTVYPGACHGFQFIPNTVAGNSYSKAHRAALAHALKIEL
ncbi:MAG: acetyl esterase/lipase [Candidatus Azotimanducaceae bacterium]|jgi:acetyl esterase/lipase